MVNSLIIMKFAQEFVSSAIVLIYCLVPPSHFQNEVNQFLVEILGTFCLIALVIICIFPDHRQYTKLILFTLLNSLIIEIGLMRQSKLLMASGSLKLTFLMTQTQQQKRIKVIYIVLTQSYAIIRVLIWYPQLKDDLDLYISVAFEIFIIVSLLFSQNQFGDSIQNTKNSNPVNNNSASVRRQKIDQIPSLEIIPMKLTFDIAQNIGSDELQSQSYRPILSPLTLQNSDRMNQPSKSIFSPKHGSVQGFTLYKQLVDILPEGVILIQAKNESHGIVYSNTNAQAMFQSSDNDQLDAQLGQKIMFQNMENDIPSQNHIKKQKQLTVIKRHGSLQTKTQKGLIQAFQNRQMGKYSPLLKLKEGSNDLSSYHSRQINENPQSLSSQIEVVWQRIKAGCHERQFIEDNSLTLELKLYTSHDLTKTTDGTEIRSLEVFIFSGTLVSKLTLVLLIRDVTHRDYIKLLQKQNKQKSQQLSFVSHEYRTPIYCIIEMLTQTIDDKQNSGNYIKCALDNSKYLLSLSDDLLDHAQLKVGKFQINVEEFNLYDMASDCLEMFNLKAKDQKIDLELLFDSCKTTKIMSDPKRVKQILINLIGNAFKFTREGCITIQISFINRLSVEITVMDTGLGIRDKDKPKLFKAFGKLNDNDSSIMNKNGVGLGLMISHQLAQELSADGVGLRMESQFKKGSQFSFILHNRIPQPSILDDIGLCERFQQSDIPSFRKLSYKNISSFKDINEFTKVLDVTQNQILIVDDNQFNLTIFQNKLKKLNQSDVDVTISGILAVEMVENRLQIFNDYKIIFMDLEMPIQDGKQTAILIQELYKKYDKKISLIACSAYHDEEENCLKIGFDDYLLKPIQLDKLKKVLELYYK